MIYAGEEMYREIPREVVDLVQMQAQHQHPNIVKVTELITVYGVNNRFPPKFKPVKKSLKTGKNSSKFGFDNDLASDSDDHQEKENKIVRHVVDFLNASRKRADAAAVASASSSVPLPSFEKNFYRKTLDDSKEIPLFKMVCDCIFATSLPLPSFE